MNIPLDPLPDDRTALVNRISEALHIHSQMSAAGGVGEGLSIVAVAQDEDAGWIEVAINSRGPNVDSRSRILRLIVEVPDHYLPRGEN